MEDLNVMIILTALLNIIAGVGLFYLIRIGIKKIRRYILKNRK